MSNKPAKRNVSNTDKTVVVDNGKCVQYISLSKTSGFTCPMCKSSTRRGIIREYKTELYCSVGCVGAVRRQEAAAIADASTVLL